MLRICFNGSFRKNAMTPKNWMRCSLVSVLFFSQRFFKATPGLGTKLDQETWLCWTHLDELQDNIWNLLDHIRSYYSILENFGPVWIILYDLRTTLTILDNFHKFLATLDWFRPFWTIVQQVWPVWTCFDLFKTCWTYWISSGPICTHLHPFGPIEW